jgi:hypothetical protein
MFADYYTGRGKRFLSSPKLPDQLWGPSTGTVSLEAAGAASYHSPPSSVKVGNDWSYTFTPPGYLNGMHRISFALKLLLYQQTPS